ncbi:MAG: histidine phosphatase family protein [Pseudomonadota bacterium]
MRLYLIRHPRPVIEPGLCYGHTDLCVDSAEVTRLTASLSRGLPNPAIVFCSPLQRCTGFADALVEAGGYANARRDPDLMEMFFGTWEMQPWENIQRREIDAWANDMAHYRPGGGESVCDVARRVLRFRDSMQQMTWADAIVVCHAGTIRLLQAWREGFDAEALAVAAASKPHAIGYGEISMIDLPSKICRPYAQRL